MYDCSAIRKLIEPSLDRELDIKEALRVQTHLKDCAQCRELLLDEQEFLALLPSALTPVPAPEETRRAVSEVLSREVRRRQQAHQRWKSLFSPSMFAAIAALIVFFAIPHPKVPPLVQIALAEHQEFMRDPAGLDIKAVDTASVARALKGRLPFPVTMPRGVGADVELVGADVAIDRIPSAILAYNVAGAPLSLLLTSPREMPFSGADTRTFKNTLFHTAFLAGLHVLQWSDHRHTYVLVACRNTPLHSLPFLVPTADGS